jgi:hypothetical protein
MQDISLGKRGIFYRSSNRNLPGVKWKFNTKIPENLRSCEHSILIEISLLNRLVNAQCYVHVELYYKDKFKGSYKVHAPKLLWWRDQNGLYTAHSGAQYLAAPIDLWDMTAKGIERPKSNQLKLL